MEINIFYTQTDWQKERPNETLEGELKFLDNVPMIETYEDGRLYRQIISPFNIFAITQKLNYGFFDIEKDIYLYMSKESWAKEEPDYVIRGSVCEDECCGGYYTFNSKEGYKQLISQAKSFSLVYER